MMQPRASLAGALGRAATSITLSPDTRVLSDCCETEGQVIACADGMDTVECWVCGARWTEACEPIEERA